MCANLSYYVALSLQRFFSLKRSLLSVLLYQICVGYAYTLVCLGIPRSNDITQRKSYQMGITI